jgi:TolB-like protein
MKNAICLLMILPAAAYSDPVYPTGNMSVAVFNFQSDKGANEQFGVADAGKNVASLLAYDLSALEPIRVVDRAAVQDGQGHMKINLGDPTTPEGAKQLGRALGATSLVSGEILGSGAQVIIAVKVVSAETGAATGAMVKGSPSTPIADLISQLGAQVGRIAMIQNGVEPTAWASAAIFGTRERATRLGTNIPHDEVACVLAIDGRVIPDEVDKWSQKQTLLPGLHDIYVRYYNGTASAGHAFVFNAKPGASYEVYFEKAHLSVASNSTVAVPPEGPVLWIRDQRTREPVTAVTQVSLGPRLLGVPTDFEFRGLNDASLGDNPDYVRSPSLRWK